MTISEAKSILQLYRPGTADAADPQIAAALALARRDHELAQWLEAHCARQLALREKFRQIAIPAGLKEQIISEQAAQQRAVSSQRRGLLLATATALVLFAALFSWYEHPAADDTLPIFQHVMISTALRGYGMDLTTNDLAQIRSYLGQHQAPADFKLSAALQQATLNGCAVESWQKTKVTMLCFHTPASANKNNLWLFVVDESSVRKANLTTSPLPAVIHDLNTVTWAQDGKLYFMGSEGNEKNLEHYL